MRAADVASARATQFRVTNELVTTDDYGLSQAWATALQRAGFGAVHAALRFTPGGTRGLALFGAAGSPLPPTPGDPNPTPAREAAEALGIEVVDPPALGSVTVVSPPIA